MNTFKNKAQRATAAVAAIAALAAGLLTATGAAAASRGFDDKLSAVVTQVRSDPNYKPIPLEGKKDNAWFFTQCEALYGGKLTKEQFVADGAKKFPGYDASFQQLADRLTAN